MTRLKQLTLLLFIIVVIVGCEDKFKKYERPEWLAGKVYTQIKEQEDLTTFTQCLEITGYDQVLDVSGSYTVFAPTNNAFQQYFQQNSKYNSVEDIPLGELTRLVKYHIVQNPWSKIQLRTLDVYGWIDTLDINNNEPKGFKRETLLLNKDMKVGVEIIDRDDEEYKIIDTLSTSWSRRIYTDSRKYAPIFYKEYFDIYDLSSSDYEFYFGRPFEGGDNIYYANAKVGDEEIFAENGFIYLVDQVVEPLKNGYEILSSDDNTGLYTDFLDLINIFPNFSYNEGATFDQPGADIGLQVDSLFDLSYTRDLVFSPNNETTRPPSGTFGLPSNVSIRYHNGLMAPTNEALQEFVEEYLEGPQQWGRFENTPRNIKRIIANTYMSVNPIYKTDIENGFYNGELDYITIDNADIIDKQYGSNSSFFGLSKAIVPRAFSSVTAPIYRRQGYSIAMNAIETSGMLSALKRQGQTYSFYVENDLDLRADSALIYNAVIERFITYQISGAIVQAFGVGTTDLRTLILNQVGIEQPNGVAKKEFIKNLAGNYIIIDNETGVVSGTAESTDGYNGSVEVDIIPQQISAGADNGVTYDVEDWFSFSSSDIYAKISASYPAFHQLLVNTGLALPREYRYEFLSQNEYYTVFIPSQEAIDNFDPSIYTEEELKNILKLHFVQGRMIFTDGNVPSGYFETARIDEASTQYTTVFTQLYIDTDYDVINIPDKNGGNFVSVPLSPSNNVICARNIGEDDDVFSQLSTNAVLHEIDKVLLIEELDTK